MRLGHTSILRGHGKCLTPIFCLHGILCSSRNWVGTASALAKATGRDVYVPDFRNHGTNVMRSRSYPMSYPSLTDDLRSILKREGVSKAVVVGHSMGGKVGMQLALQCPDIVESLLVVDTAPAVYAHITGLMKTIQKICNVEVEGRKSEEEIRRQIEKLFYRDPGFQRALAKNCKQVEEGGQYEWNFDLGGIASSLYNIVCAPFPSKLGEEGAAKEKEKGHVMGDGKEKEENGTFTTLSIRPDEMPQTRYYEQSYAASPSAVKEGEVKTDDVTSGGDGWTYTGPTMFLAGSRSDFISPSTIPRIKQFFPGASIRTLPGGHFVFEDSEKEFLDMVIAFVNGDSK